MRRWNILFIALLPLGILQWVRMMQPPASRGSELQKKLPQELCRSGRDYQRKLQGTAVFAAETDRLTSFERFENEDAIYKGQLTQRNYDNDPPTGIQGSIRSVVPSDDDATSPEAVGSEEEACSQNGCFTFL